MQRGPALPGRSAGARQSPSPPQATSAGEMQEPAAHRKKGRPAGGARRKGEPSAPDDGLESLVLQTPLGLIRRLRVGVWPDLHPVILVRSGGQDKRGKLLLLKRFGQRQRVALAPERSHLEKNRALGDERRREQRLRLG